MDATGDILKKIVQLQKSHGYSDTQMAAKIGCSRPLYQRTRTGKIPVGGTFLKGALKLLASPVVEDRKSTIVRETGETKVNLELNIDGIGKWDINTGIRIFDHFLSQVARHGLFDIKIRADGDDVHHIVEDVAISLGQAFGKALSDKRGIVRMAEATVPMDDALATVVVDIGGRGYCVSDLPFNNNDILGFPPDLIRHFLESFAIEARLNLHAKILYGRNDHHKAETLFKALGRALDAATKIDERIAGELPSTKAFIEK